METRAPYVLVGVFMMVLVAGVVVSLLWFARIQFREQVNYYDIYFTESVSGLTPGSIVRYNGLAVGRISEIRLDPTDPTRVRVTVQLQGGVPIKPDTIAQIEPQGLTGNSFINLTGGTREEPPLARQPGQRYPVIASRPSGLQRFVEGAPELLARMTAAADSLRELLSPQNRQALSETLENLRRISAVAASHSDEIDRALTDGATALHDLRQTLETANAILADLKQLVEPNRGMEATLRSIAETSRQVGDLAQHIDRVVAENAPQIQGFTRTGLDQLEQLIQQTRELVAQLSNVVQSVSRDPSRLLYGDRREGYRPQ